LFSSGVELLNTLGRFPWFNAESSRTLCPLKGKNTLGFANSGSCLGVTRQSFLPVPGDSVITAP
jgi:hypothetical protein